MTAKEFLRQYTEANEVINDKLEEVSRLRAKAVAINVTLNPNQVQSSGDNDPLASIIGKIIDMEREVDQEIDHLREIKQVVMAAIMGVADHKQRRVLYHRYILGKKWCKIAEALKTDERWIYRLHDEALRKINFDQ